MTSYSTWRTARVDLKSEKRHQLILEAEVGAGFLGDIAVDDIIITETPCGKKCSFSKFLF